MQLWRILRQKAATGDDGRRLLPAQIVGYRDCCPHAVAVRSRAVKSDADPVVVETLRVAEQARGALVIVDRDVQVAVAVEVEESRPA